MNYLNLPQRKGNRLNNFDYCNNGAYFITICTQNRRCFLSHIVGRGLAPAAESETLSVVDTQEHVENQYTKYGKIAELQLLSLKRRFPNLTIDKYVIMPDHIHILLTVQNGQSRTPVPTNEKEGGNKNSTVSKFVSTLKRFCNKEFGENIWQSRYYDHVIRNQKD